VHWFQSVQRLQELLVLRALCQARRHVRSVPKSRGVGAHITGRASIFSSSDARRL
jgi:hypothetical protein